MPNIQNASFLCFFFLIGFKFSSSKANQLMNTRHFKRSGSPDNLGSPSNVSSVGAASIRSSKPTFSQLARPTKNIEAKRPFRITIGVSSPSSLMSPNFTLNSLLKETQWPGSASKDSKYLSSRGHSPKKYGESTKGVQKLLFASNEPDFRRQSPDRNKRDEFPPRNNQDMKEISSHLAVMSHHQRINEIQNKIMSSFQTLREDASSTTHQNANSKGKLPYRRVEEDEKGLHIVGGGPVLFQSRYKPPPAKLFPSQRPHLNQNPKSIQDFLNQSGIGDISSRSRTQNDENEVKTRSPFQTEEHFLGKPNQPKIKRLEFQKGKSLNLESENLQKEERNPKRTNCSFGVGLAFDSTETNSEQSITKKDPRKEKAEERIQRLVSLNRKDERSSSAVRRIKRECGAFEPRDESVFGQDKRGEGVVEDKEVGGKIKEAVQKALENEKNTTAETMRKEIEKIREEFQLSLRQKDKKIEELTNQLSGIKP